MHKVPSLHVTPPDAKPVLAVVLLVIKFITHPYLSENILLLLREYYKEYSPNKYLFEGQKGGKYTGGSVFGRHLIG